LKSHNSSPEKLKRSKGDAISEFLLYEIESLDISAINALHLCCLNGNSKALRLLIQFGVDVNATTKDNFQFCGLHLATLNRHKDVVACLISQNCNVNICDNLLGFSALHICSLFNYEDIALILTASETCDYEKRDKSSRTGNT
jgi:ankyrin repeat protein